MENQEGVAAQQILSEEDIINILNNTAFTRIVTNRVYSKFFVEYIVAAQALQHMQELYLKGSSSPMLENEAFPIHSKQMNQILFIFPYHVIRGIVDNTDIRKISTKFINAEILDADHAPDMGQLDGIMVGLAQTMFTNYYEYRQADALKHFGAKNKWPDTWNFGRVVRNALSHGGKIAIDDVKAKPVKWGKLAYDHASNNRVIFHLDIWPGDLFFLMADMDDELMLKTNPEGKAPKGADLPYGGYR